MAFPALAVVPLLEGGSGVAYGFAIAANDNALLTLVPPVVEAAAAASAGGAVVAGGLVLGGLVLGGLAGQALWDYFNPDQARLFHFNQPEAGEGLDIRPGYQLGAGWVLYKQCYADGDVFGTGGPVLGPGDGCLSHDLSGAFPRGTWGSVTSTMPSGLETGVINAFAFIGNDEFTGVPQDVPTWTIVNFGAPSEAFVPATRPGARTIPLEDPNVERALGPVSDHLPGDAPSPVATPGASQSPVVQWAIEGGSVSRAPSLRASVSPAGIPAPPRSRGPDRTKEKKTKSKGMAVLEFARLVSEASDVVGAVYKALPKNIRQRWDRKYKVKDTRFGYALTGQYASINDSWWQLEAIWYNWDKIDGAQAVANVVNNEIQDRIIGRLVGPTKNTAAVRASQYWDVNLSKLTKPAEIADPEWFRGLFGE